MAAARDDLTAAEVRALLDYDSETGVFRWRAPSKYHREKTGAIAGTNLPGKRTQYRVILINRHPYKAHRLAWLWVHGEWPAGQIDHINGDGLDNRIENLRDVSQTLNARNARRHAVATSGHVGIRQVPSGRWEARIGGGGRSLGVFDTQAQALAIREAAAQAMGYTDRHGGVD